VTRRLERILAKEGIRVAVLTTEIAPEQGESWYERLIDHQRNVTNRKPEHGRGKVQLIDATTGFKPLRKNLGKEDCVLQAFGALSTTKFRFYYGNGRNTMTTELTGPAQEFNLEV